MDIDAMAVAAHENAISHGWYDQPRTFGDELALFHSEVSEALEAYRRHGYDYYLRTDGKPEGVMSELADVIIRIGDTAERLRRAGHVKQTLGEAIAEKMAWNTTRPYRHGAKKL